MRYTIGPTSLRLIEGGPHGADGATTAGRDRDQAGQGEAARLVPGHDRTNWLVSL
jgi:hypothetical protein